VKVLFLSHAPHGVHLEFAKQVGARVEILPLNKYIQLAKKLTLLEYIYPLVSAVCSLFIPVREEILLVDGGSSLYAAVFLKLRNSKLKIIYLDADLLFYKMQKRNPIVKKAMMFFVRAIDGVISVSEQNRKYLPIGVPVEICAPYPQNAKRVRLKRQNWGVYVGRLDPDKRIKRIVEFGLQCPFFEKFVVAGDGVLRDYLVEQSRKHDKLVYEGVTDKVNELFSKCKFLIHIPDHDPHPCTTMEAAMCGCFPILSKGTGSSYLFSSFFVADNPDDFSELNEKIRYILSDDKRARDSLRKSLMRIPTRRQSLKNFRNAFIKVCKSIK